MLAFSKRFPKVGEKETRVLTVLHKERESSLPPDRYGFVEFYCHRVGCDCRRVLISVIADEADRIVATISMGFDGRNKVDGPYLDPISPQSEYSDELIHIFTDMINHDPDYLARLQRHYVMFREDVEGKPYTGKPFKRSGRQRRVVEDYFPGKPRDRMSVKRQDSKVGRNQPCPCGSGKKYKMCCLLMPVENVKKQRAIEKTGGEVKKDADDKRDIRDINPERGETKNAADLVGQVVKSLQKNAEKNPVDGRARKKIQKNPKVVYPLLDLLLNCYAPKGYVREMSKEYHACLLLIEEALTEIRYSIERNRKWAIETSELIQKKIAEQAFKVEVDTRVQGDLLQALYRAKLELHHEIQKESENLAEYYSRFTSHGESQDIERFFDELIKGGIKNPFDIYEQVMPELTILPIEGQLGLITEMAMASSPLIREVAALMLLHPNHEIRIHVSLIFSQFLDPKTVSPVTLCRMINLRNWLPKVERPALDEAIKRVRKSRVECAALPQVLSIQVYASPFDGSGVQGVWAFTKRKGRYQLGGVLVHQEQGIREAWAMSNISKGDLRSLMREAEQGGMAKQVLPIYLDQLISHFIWLGQKQGNPPPPELLHVAEATGIGHWQPKPLIIDEEFALLEEDAGAESLSPQNLVRVLEDSGDWLDSMDFAISWFEDDSQIDDILKKGWGHPLRNHKAIKKTVMRIINSVLEKKRAIWAERLLWMALWAKSINGTTTLSWKNFFIVARELQNDTPLTDIPLMIAVAERSIYYGLQRLNEL